MTTWTVPLTEALEGVSFMVFRKKSEVSLGSKRSQDRLLQLNRFFSNVKSSPEVF